MSTNTGWQFQCFNTTCLPYATIIVPNIRRCQMACLAQVYCHAVTFHRSPSDCELFADISNQNGNLLANMDAVTMIVIDGTRVPPEPTTTSTTTSSSTSSSTSSTSTTTTSSSSSTSTTTSSMSSSTSSTTSTTTTTTTTSSSTSSTSSTTTTSTSTSSTSSTTTAGQ
ncbi:unnamed protein product [Adineta steineri]|uniref:Apple domain-containing protein n=1 Tax=Adineta steineri TaxID=433720 RepID=A0A813TAW4_9BILA|nr:unnamed protein product [Adineta steineri]CAF0805780.1 unnamed protein product [Adineta steineri]CAF3570474.1 unnamed protein product [Adineta steineri]CAF3988459.1 unnamed protein product [Adineta steineri]